MKERNESSGMYEYIEEIIIICVIVLILIFVYVHFDKKAEQENWYNFRRSLPSLDIFSKLTEEDKNSLLEQAREKYNANYNKWGKFIGGTIDEKWADRIRDEYRDDAFFKNEEYFK